MRTLFPWSCIKKDEMNQAVISLGSNINPEENIKKTKGILVQKFKPLKESAFISTKPVGNAAQPDFINGSVLIETPLNLESLQTELKKIETSLGREKTQDKFGPRTIDLDVVVFNRKIIDPDFYSRGYLKQAVLELLPGLEF